MGKKIDWKEIDDEYKRYKAYLRSDDFDVVRQAVFERDNHHCMCCGRTSEEATLVPHHNSYKHLYNELEHLDDMTTVCKICHRSIHINRANWVRFKR